jgi:hypothetical protein
VIGYLSAVASRLDQIGITVRELRAQEPNAPRLAGTLTLAPIHTPGAGWSPARLCWEEDSGWAATLLPEGGNGEKRFAVYRYLPHVLVPAPATVAHFGAALRVDPDTIWASSTFDPPHKVDRRWMIRQLTRFAPPEP